MKNLNTLIVLILCSLCSYSQNPFAFNYGTSPAEVSEGLKSKKNVRIRLNTPGVLIAEAGNVELEYKFENSKLKEMTFKKYFDHRKDAKNTLQLFREYFRNLGAGMDETEQDKNFGTIIAVEDHQYHMVRHNYSLDKELIVYTSTYVEESQTGNGMAGEDSFTNMIASK